MLQIVTPHILYKKENFNGYNNGISLGNMSRNFFIEKKNKKTQNKIIDFFNRL